MPIPYSKLKYNDILHHQTAYDCFDKAGKVLFSDWDMVGFEKAVLGNGEPRYLKMAEQIMKTPNLFGNLDKKMPFLRFREDGQHYGYELFLSPPKHWFSRGAPLWWAYAARKFTYDKLPMNEQYFYEKYKGIAKEFGLSIQNGRYEYIERFDAGGMSGGVVDEQFIRRGWYDVRRRNRLYQRNEAAPERLYLDGAKERINHYFVKLKDNNYMLNPDIADIDFLLAFEDTDMTDRQKDLVSRLWGLYSGKPMTVRELAEQIGVTRERITQIENTCIRHILSNKNRSDLILEKEERPPNLK